MIKVHLINKSKNTEFAKAELIKYLNKIFDKECIESTMEEADYVLGLINESGNDQIKITTQNGQIWIEGSTSIALLISVYRYLQEIGAKFLRPGEVNEILPTLEFAKQEKQFAINETASFKHRGVCIEGADSFENIVEFIDWLPKVGYNSFFIQFENPYSFLKRWYDHEFNGYIEKEEFNTSIAQEMSDGIDKEMSKRGIVHHRVGHGWTSETLGFSSKFGWESGLQISEEKRHLVAQLDGKRELYNGAPILTSLDFANSEVINNMVEQIVDYSKVRKDVDYLHVWLSDARNNICECEECKKEIPSDQYVRMLNQLDIRLTEEGLETKICFLLYHELLFAPEVESLINQERFTMMFAPITRTFEMSYADVDYKKGVPEVKKYVRNKMDLPNSLEENLSYLFSWQKKFKGDSFVYDYPLGRAHYGDLGYMKISKVIYRDIKYLNNLNLNGYISCQELRSAFPHSFPNYVMGKMLWNNSLSYEDLQKEYFMTSYGETDYKNVIEYLEKLSYNSSCDYFNAIGERSDSLLSLKYMLSKNIATEFLPIIEKNYSISNGFEKEQWRVLSYHREFVMKLSGDLELLSKGNERDAQYKWREVTDLIRREENNFQQYLDVYRIIEVATNYTGFKL